MLVLARKIGQKIRIGSDIELVVVAVQGDVVRLGISAPKGVPIHRQEIFDAITAENQAAADVSVADVICALAKLHPPSSQGRVQARNIFLFSPKVSPDAVDNKVECSARDEQLSGKEAARKFKED